MTKTKKPIKENSSARQVELMVICNCFDKLKCSQECPHNKHHKPLYDCNVINAVYDLKDGYCNIVQSLCGYRSNASNGIFTKCR